MLNQTFRRVDGFSADKLRMSRFAQNWLKSAACVLVRVFLHKFLLGNFSFLSYRDPENKHGVLEGNKIKTTKMKEIQRKWTKRWWRPRRMNFKLNECHHSNCFKTKVQLNKCEIHIDVTFTFHSPEGATVIFGLVFLGNQTICRQTNSQSSQLTDWSTCGLVKSPKCVM